MDGGHEGKSGGEGVKLAQSLAKHPGTLDQGDEREGHVYGADQDVGRRQVGQQQVGARSHAAVTRDRRHHQPVSHDRRKADLQHNRVKRE